MIVNVEIDSSPALDALHELQFARHALFRSHGDAFRALAAKIDHALDQIATATREDSCGMEFICLSDGRFVLTAPPVVTHLLRDARALGVI